MLDIRVLGPIEVRVDDELVSVGGARPRTLLATLALHRGKPVSVDTLIDSIWGEQPPRTAAKTLQKYVSEIRKVLGDAVATRPGSYVLSVDCDAIDACRFEAVVGESLTLPPHDARVTLETALAAWRGEPFADLLDNLDAEAERSRLIERRLEAEANLIQARLDLGGHSEVIGRLEELVSTHPMRERFWSMLMLALYRDGRQAEALRSFRRLCDELADVGLEPTQELRDLEQQILLQDPTLTIPVRTSALTNLPQRSTSFIGRRTDIRTVQAMCGTTRLATLVGPAGSGKTRLALEVAGQEVGAMQDGVWFVDLATLTSPDEIPRALAEPLGVASHGDRPVLDVLLDVLRGRKLMLVVDNCEHLVADVARILARVLVEAPAVCLLATSREPLGIEGEHTYEVPPLPVPSSAGETPITEAESVVLFVDRARQVDPTFHLDANNAEAIREICERLDGIPLAVELAAARIRAYTPAEIAGLLDDRFTLLESPIRTESPRHRTLQAAIDWSYETLTDEERILFERVSVFRGSFDRTAVERVCSSDPLADDAIVILLPRLVDRSLMVVETHGDASRYRVLETLREYGWGRLDAAERADLRNRHAAHYCELAERVAPLLRTVEQTEWIARMTDEYANLRRALRWAFSHHPEMGVRLAIALAILWDAVGPRTEAQEWMRRAVDLAAGDLAHFYVPARLVAADLFVSTEVSHTIRYAEEAIAEARRRGDSRGEAGGLRALGWARALEDDYETAVDLGEEAVAIWRSIGDDWETAWSLERLGESDFLDPDRALERLEESLALYGRVGDRRRAAMVKYKIAETAARAGRDLSQAQHYVEESLDVFERMGSVHDSAHALLELGRIRRRRGDPEGARRALESGLERMRLVGDQRCETRTLAALGTALVDGGNASPAWDRLIETLQLADEIGERQMARVALAGLGRVAAERNRPREATLLTAAADRIASDLGVPTSERSARHRAERLEALRASLGDDDFETAWREGFAMGTDAAVARALAQPVPRS